MVRGKAVYEVADLYLVVASVASRSGIHILCASSDVASASRFRIVVRGFCVFVSMHVGSSRTTGTDGDTTARIISARP
jgi:hypothetical protein